MVGARWLDVDQLDQLPETVSDETIEVITGYSRRMIAKKQGSIVLIRADKSVPYKTIQRLIAVAKSAGAAQIALATEPLKK